ncbi:unnamed protein product [Symbiodinium sp. KB8]|nr:unnamed protein product [Symbiodinium sp. KB8]
MGSRLFDGARMEPAPTPEPTVSLLNDLRNAVELDLGEGWQELEPWQSRQMAREGFAIRLSADRTRIWRIGTDELVSQGQNLRTSKDLGLFSQEMKAEAYREWSEMYLEDVPGGKRQLVNDLDAAVEVDSGRGWRILYPNQKRELSEESFSIRLREDQAVMILARCGIATGVATAVTLLVLRVQSNGLEDPEELVRNHPMGYLLFLFFGAFAGTLARSLLPDGPARDDLRVESRRRLLEETIVFQGTVMEEHGKPCITSWPGKYATAWDCLVESAREGETSAAVVFLPEGTKEFGKHSTIPHSEGLAGECWCTPLYGEQKPWGCKWWALWIGNVEKAVQVGAELHVYFFQQACGQGKVESFDTAGRENLRREAIFARMSEFEESEEYRYAKEAGIKKLCKKKRHDSSSQHSREKHRLFLQWLSVEDARFLKESEGLGNSQKAEVAWLERKGYRYTEVDISRWLPPDEPQEEISMEWSLQEPQMSSLDRVAYGCE